MAKIIREDFLQQSAFSVNDKWCPLLKTTCMMRAIVTFYESSIRLIKDSPSDNKIPWSVIATHMHK